VITNINLRTWLNLAKTTARHSNYKIKMGAVIVQHGTPIAVGFNRVKSHPRWVSNLNATVHAEISALIVAGKCDVTGAIIFVYREHKNGLPALARPCANCMAVLAERGIKRVVYSIDTFPFYIEEKI
jgi:deoxycytidylate deaminase